MTPESLVDKLYQAHREGKDKKDALAREIDELITGILEQHRRVFESYLRAGIKRYDEYLEMLGLSGGKKSGEKE